jgi:hypothetical protein
MHCRLFRLVPYALMAVSIALTAMVALAPMPNRPVAAFFPPWWSAERTFGAAARSGAPIVRFGSFTGILVLAAGEPELFRRLHEAGAWLLLDAQALGACAVNI